MHAGGTALHGPVLGVQAGFHGASAAWAHRVFVICVLVADEAQALPLRTEDEHARHRVLGLGWGRGSRGVLQGAGAVIGPHGRRRPWQRGPGLLQPHSTQPVPRSLPAWNNTIGLWHLAPAAPRTVAGPAALQTGSGGRSTGASSAAARRPGRQRWQWGERGTPDETPGCTRTGKRVRRRRWGGGAGGPLCGVGAGGPQVQACSMRLCSR